jgi:hypothetical protein
MGQLGYRLIWNSPGSLATSINTAFFALVVVASIALYGAIWQAFSAGTARGARTFGIAVAAIVVAYGMRIHGGDFATMRVDSDGNLVFTLARLSLFSWATVEAFHHSAMLKKRMKLGLANPMAANQIQLWGVAAVFSFFMTLIIGHNSITLHRSPLEDPLSTALLMACVFISSGSMWCAFFPPTAMRRRFETLPGSS